jgi:hypothetical protein
MQDSDCPQLQERKVGDLEHACRIQTALHWCGRDNPRNLCGKCRSEDKWCCAKAPQILCVYPGQHDYGRTQVSDA